MAINIGRREFTAALGGVATWPLAARAQQGEGVRRISVLMGLAEGDPETSARLTKLRLDKVGRNGNDSAGQSEDQ